jgi:uncharacterized protein (DUF1330 family)
MPAYIVVLININDPAKYEEHAKAWNVQSFTEDYGGEFLMMSNEPEVIEGDWSGRLVVMKFPDAENAHAWYDSPSTTMSESFAGPRRPATWFSYPAST